ncbi:MAG: phosphoenolpyruvate carboxykinase domain-containing protein, partial [Ilumatobacteraceae bacterium]
GEAQAVDTPIGRLPAPGSLDTDGLEIADADLEAILSVDTDGWRSAIPEIRDHFASFGERLPAELIAAVDRLERSLDPA